MGAKRRGAENRVKRKKHVASKNQQTSGLANRLTGKYAGKRYLLTEGVVLSYNFKEAKKPNSEKLGTEGCSMQSVVFEQPEIKMISISSKRQVTIPQKFFSELGFQDEAECFLRGGEIVIRPYKRDSEFSEQILAELIAEGYSGTDLLEKFRQRKCKVRPAVEQLVKAADELAENSMKSCYRAAQPQETFDELFGD